MGQRVMEDVVTITTTGSAGSATGTGTSSSLNGFLLDITADWHASAPATSDLTVTYALAARGNLVVISNSSTDNIKAPRGAVYDATGTAISGSSDLYPLSGPLTLSVAQCDALTGAVVVYIRYIRTR